MAWTAAQQQAIESRGSGLIVSAAAGSGKTSVLVERLLRILTEEDPEKRVPADRMIVVTFTNDAAAEMKARLSQALDLQIQQNPENRWLYQQQILLQSAQICTISSFCFYLIRNHFTHGGITSGFRILNDTESRMIAAKSADQVLNQWHQTRPEDMKLLWDAFCEKNDTPLEQILLQFHQFLASVPFRDQWETAALRSFLFRWKPISIISRFRSGFCTWLKMQRSWPITQLILQPIFTKVPLKTQCFPGLKKIAAAFSKCCST